MKEKPILFSTPMVQAILAGNKTMTRRVIKLEGWLKGDPIYETRDGLFVPIESMSRYQPGDHLWVRENWSPWADKETQIAAQGEEDPCLYRADYRADCKSPRDIGGDFWWHSARFMFKKDTRIWLDITAVRAERLQEISPHELSTTDLLQEGLPKHNFGIDFTTDLERYVLLKDFISLWDSINAKRGYSWESNPWVWVYTFKRIKC